jgi:hypothetical protein
MFNKDQQDQNAAMLDMDIQQEEILAFFQDYWKPIVGIAIILVLVTGSLQIYRALNARVAAEQTAILLPLAASQPTLQSAKALEDFAASKATGSRRALALLFAASKYQTVGKPDDMRRTLKAVMDSEAPEDIRNYARILFVNAGGDVKTLDRINKKSAWQIAATEILALGEKDSQKQRDDFAVIAVDPTAPPGMHARAAELAGQPGTE